MREHDGEHGKDDVEVIREVQTSPNEVCVIQQHGCYCFSSIWLVFTAVFSPQDVKFAWTGYRVLRSDTAASRFIRRGAAPRPLQALASPIPSINIPVVTRAIWNRRSCILTE